jgi:hypothetical protein
MDNLAKRILEANTGRKANQLAEDIHNWLLAQKITILMDYQEYTKVLEKKIEKNVYNS